MTRTQDEMKAAAFLIGWLPLGFFLGFDDVRDWAALSIGAVLAGWMTARVFAVLRRRTEADG